MLEFQNLLIKREQYIKVLFVPDYFKVDYILTICG